jgi:hypothetical protein
MVVIAVLCWMFEGVTCVGLPVCIYLFPIVIGMFPIVISRFWYPVISDSFSRPASPLPFPFLLKIYSCSNGWGVFLTVPGRFQAYTPNARKNGKRKKSDNKIFVKVCEKKITSRYLWENFIRIEKVCEQTFLKKIKKNWKTFEGKFWEQFLNKYLWETFWT